jgi:hypothetical protein
MMKSLDAVLPRAMNLKKSVPFHNDLDSFLGEWSSAGEAFLWLASVSFGIIFCELVSDISKAFSPVVFPGHAKLSKKEKVEWDSRSVSTAHATVASIVAFYLLYISDIFRDDAPYGPVMFRSTLLSQFSLGFSCGYFLADMAMMYRYYPDLGGLEFFVHHLLSIISLVLGVHSGHSHVYICMVLLSECTTPLVNLRWYMSVLGQKDSKLYFINGFSLTLLWLVARILLFLYCFTHMYAHREQMKQLHNVAYVFLILAPGGLGFMNAIWFFKILQSFFRILNRKQAH